MPKISTAKLILAGVLSTFLVAGSASASLWGYFNEHGQTLPSIKDRVIMAAECGIGRYTGSLAQNKILETCLRGEGLLGYAVATGYQKNLSAPITATQTYLPVSSLALRDGTTLAMSNLGDKVFLFLEPGGSKEEIVVCTGINTSSVWFTGCTRGLAFQGSSEVAVAANQKTHSAGSTVLMSNVHYVYEQFPDLMTNQTVTGTWTFEAFPKVSSTTALPTTADQLANKYYVDNVGAGGFTASNVSTTLGLKATGSVPEKVGINASSTTGMAFDSAGKLYQMVSSTTGLAQDSNGIYINGASDLTWTGGQTFVSSTLTTTTIKSATITDELKLSGDTVANVFTAGEAIDSSSGPLAVYLHSDGLVYKTDADYTTTTFPFVGFAVKGQSVGASASVYVQTSGIVKNFSGMTTGTNYFIDNTVGVVSSTKGTYGYKVGRALSPTKLLIEKGKKIYTYTQTITAANQTTTTIGFKANTVKVFAIDASADQSYGTWTDSTGYATAEYWSASPGVQVYTNVILRTHSGTAIFSGELTVNDSQITLTVTETNAPADIVIVVTAEE